MHWQEIASASVTLFLVLDPLGNVPIFNSVLARCEPTRRARIILREVILALIILMGFLVAGNKILGFLGLSQSSLSIAGGVLLFIISMRMIFPPGRGGAIEADGDEEPFLVPLAIPLIAGPSTIAMLLLLSSSAPDRLGEWAFALFIAWAATAILLVLSPWLLKHLGDRGSRALERLMGMILVIVAVQMFLNGIRDFVTSL